MIRDVDPTPGQAGLAGSGTSGTGGCELITPFGGKLVDLVVHDPRRARRPARARAEPPRGAALAARPVRPRDARGRRLLAARPVHGARRVRVRPLRDASGGRRALPDPAGGALPRGGAARSRQRGRAVGRGGRHPRAARGGRGLPGGHPARDARCAGRQGQRAPAGHRGQALAEPLPGRPSARVRPPASPAARPNVPHAGGLARAAHRDGQLDGGRLPDAQPHAPHPRGAHQARAPGGRRDAPHPSGRRRHAAAGRGRRAPRRGLRGPGATTTTTRRTRCSR